MNVQIQGDLRMLKIAVNEVVDILAVVDQQILADQLRVVRQPSELRVLGVEGPVHLLDEIDHAEAAVDLWELFHPALKIAYLRQQYGAFQSIQCRCIEGDRYRHGADQAFVYVPCVLPHRVVEIEELLQVGFDGHLVDLGGATDQGAADQDDDQQRVPQRQVVAGEHCAVDQPRATLDAGPGVLVPARDDVRQYAEHDQVDEQRACRRDQTEHLDRHDRAGRQRGQPACRGQCREQCRPVDFGECAGNPFRTRQAALGFQVQRIEQVYQRRHGERRQQRRDDARDQGEWLIEKYIDGDGGIDHDADRDPGQHYRQPAPEQPPDQGEADGHGRRDEDHIVAQHRAQFGDVHRNLSRDRAEIAVQTMFSHRREDLFFQCQAFDAVAGATRDHHHGQGRAVCGGQRPVGEAVVHDALAALQRG